jgi:hypothetical protein
MASFRHLIRTLDVAVAVAALAVLIQLICYHFFSWRPQQALNCLLAGTEKHLSNHLHISIYTHNKNIIMINILSFQFYFQIVSKTRKQKKILKSIFHNLSLRLTLQQQSTCVRVIRKKMTAYKIRNLNSVTSHNYNLYFQQ